LIDYGSASGQAFVDLIRSEGLRYDDVIRRTGVKIER